MKKYPRRSIKAAGDMPTPPYLLRDLLCIKVVVLIRICHCDRVTGLYLREITFLAFDPDIGRIINDRAGDHFLAARRR